MEVIVVGGVYREVVMWPAKDEIFGSAGRGACALAQLGTAVRLVTYADPSATQVLHDLATVYQFTVHPAPLAESIAFRYVHGLATPTFARPSSLLPSLTVQADRVVRYGMLESDAVVDAAWAVYDPQNTHAPEPFRANGSSAERLAIVLNEHEATQMAGPHADAHTLAGAVAALDQAQVVVLKRGPKGALVWDRGITTEVPAFETSHVAKVGSGDYFVAHFAYRWMVEGLPAASAAAEASRATARYCQGGAYPTLDDLTAFHPASLQLGPRWLSGYRPIIYLAGPFFSLAQLWLIEEARKALWSMGLRVFSPYHDVGPGDAQRVVPLDLQAIRDCDSVFAVVDGLDAGTVYEIGYARALGKPVVVYCENEASESLKMMQGSDCFVMPDFVSALYKMSWVAISA